MSLKFNPFLICLLLIGLSSFSQTINYSEKLVFDDVAYITSPINGKKVISKWAGPIRYQINNSPSEFITKEIDTTFSEIKKLTSLDIKKAVSNEEANLIINLGKEDKAKNISTPSGSVMKYNGNFNHKTNDKLEIIKVENLFIVADSETKADIKYSLKRMILKSFGFFRKSEEAPYSLFYAQRNNAIKIDKFDGHIISFFYSSFVKAGMEKDQLDKMFGF
ncbi:DUF2927 domain-containing protein [Pedobacter frigiditerrae]|uniref:DUF2927 domain-containing protein n=1 Tax=Pedobacter frigiditerrae TaxID=2530452 RepID=A0A4R0N2C5_9SPHI|nr:DUF2927 domain-containing protein [Pedobacter frigiditerrae]TCC93988.1 DUF2927 domain-containing protein [Pedobacter frigiditerrae]